MTLRVYACHVVNMRSEARFQVAACLTISYFDNSENTLNTSIKSMQNRKITYLLEGWMIDLPLVIPLTV